MIELDDAVGTLNLGVNEYVVLTALEIGSIRQFLLLDIERIVSAQDCDASVGERLSVWQNLLRKYLTVDKVEAARAKDDVEKEKLTIRAPLAKAGVDQSDAAKLAAKGIMTIRDLIDLDEEAIAALDSSLAEHVISLRSELMNKNLVDTVVKEALLEVYSTRTASYNPESEKEIDAADFINRPITESGINPNELDILRILKITTVKEFLEMDINRPREVKGYPERTYQRLHSWQKFLAKRLLAIESEET